MAQDIDEIKDMIGQNMLDEALEALNSLIGDGSDNDELYYLRGNVYRKFNNWKCAMGDYLKASAINPDSPATAAYNSALQILEYYNKDLLNP